MTSFSRELLLWADFNSVDADRRFVASLRFATTPAKPAKGERVRLHDDEGNSVVGVVEEIDGMIVRVRPDMATWTSSDVSVDSPFASPATFHASPLGGPVK
jgi:hypothetical protein